MNIVPLTLIEYHIRMCEKHGWPYTAQVSNFRTILRSARFGEEMNVDGSFPMKELHFIKQVRNYIIDNELYNKVKKRFKNDEQKKKIKYFYYNKRIQPGQQFDDCIEIDANSAFWIILNNLGMLSPELFAKGHTVHKKTRLAAAGTLAKSYRIFTFDGKKTIISDPIRSELTEHIWDELCYKMGAMMGKAARLSKDDFIFFWVDAIFIKGESAKIIHKFLKALGFGWNSYKCEYIRFDERKIEIKCEAKGKWVMVKDPKTGKKIRVWKNTRPFPYKRAMSEADIIKLSNEAL